MNKRAFTLVELIISITLLGIIVIFLYSSTTALQKSNKIFYENEKKLEVGEDILNMLYKDIFQSNELNISGKNSVLLNLKTKNSLFNISMPYVSWFVSKDENTLLRFESIYPFSKMNNQNSYYYHISVVAKECEKFQIYQSKNKKYILIYIKLKNSEPLIYEFYKPFPVKKAKNKIKIELKNPNQKDKNLKQNQNPHIPNNPHREIPHGFR